MKVVVQCSGRNEVILGEDTFGYSIANAGIKRPASLMEAVGNIVDEPASMKEQALTAAFASMALVSHLPLGSFVSFHIVSIKGYGASFELISDCTWRAVKLSSNGTV